MECLSRAVRLLLCLVVLPAFPLFGCTRPGLAAPVVSAKLVTARPVTYGVTEFDVTLTGATFTNPFDPDEVAVWGELSGPAGKVGMKVRTVPAFWYQPYRVEKGWPEPTGEPGRFRLRVAAGAPGQWTLTVRARDNSGTSEATRVSFPVVADKNRGFVKRAPGSSRYLMLSDGSPYFPVGENVCWAGQRGLLDYEDWFGALGRAGGNYARLWMAFQPLESKESGLGRYDLKNADYFDHVLELAGKNGIRCMLAFGTYGEFTTGGYFNEGRWPVNPYNAANGGPVPADKPDDFFTNEQARAIYKKRLRYLIARYGAYTSVAFWEFWNEKGGPASWFAEMARYMKETDPYGHLVTNSYPTTGEASVWNIPEIDLTQTHRYGDEGSVRDITPIIVSDSRAHDAFGKPHLMGEFGISWRGPDDKFDPNHTATNLHNGLWSAAFSGGAGGAAIWWWDNYVHPRNLYGEFTGLARFTATVDWPRRTFTPLDLDPPLNPATGSETFTDAILTPEGAWGYVQKSPATLNALGGLIGDALPGYLYGPEKKDMQAPAVLRVKLAKPSMLRVRVVQVSNHASLRVKVNGASVGEFAFDASPTGPKGYESTKQFPEYGGIYQAVFNKDVTVPLPAGESRIELENATGDWLTLGPITVGGARSSRYAGLRTVALQDAKADETLVWVQDTESNWANDRDGKKPVTWQGVALTVPVPADRSYRVTWWDTRAGKPVESKTISAKGNRLPLTIPTFTRDIALRVVSARR